MAFVHRATSEMTASTGFAVLTPTVGAPTFVYRSATSDACIAQLVAEVSGSAYPAVNPDVLRAQMEGCIGYGLSALYYSEIELKAGRAVQRNFDTYRALRIHEMPKVEVHIVQSTEKPTGVGEPGLPPLAPAVANAVAKLGGQRVRRLPFARAGMVEDPTG